MTTEARTETDEEILTRLGKSMAETLAANAYAETWKRERERLGIPITPEERWERLQPAIGALKGVDIEEFKRQVREAWD